MDVFLSYNHPYFTLVTDENLDEFIDNSLNTEKSYVFYINYFCDENSIKEIIEKHGFSLSKPEFQKGSYEAYVYEG